MNTATLLAVGLAAAIAALAFFLGHQVALRRNAAAAQALARSETLFRSLWETTNDGVLIVGADNRIRFANPEIHAFLGHPPGSLNGQSLAVVQPQRMRAGHDAGMARHMATGERHVNWRGTEVMALHSDGRELPMEIRFSSFELDGQRHFVGFMRDIAERKRIEQERHETQQQLEKRVAERTEELTAANERLRELDRLKSEFLANMSHELRTPLNSILGFTDVLRHGLAGPVNDEQRRQLDFVRGSGEHLLALISDLLDLSRIESGRMEVAHEAFDFAATAREVADQLRPLAQRKSLALSLELAPSLPWVGDRRKVVQVLLNLLGNAIKFTAEGTVTLRAQLAAPGKLAFDVVDTGIGIEPAQQAALFRAFQQVDAGLGRSHEGTGLGLYLTRKLLELMGGSISMESGAGTGTVFHVQLPRAAGASPHA